MNARLSFFTLVLWISISTVFGKSSLTGPEAVDVGKLRVNELKKFTFPIKNRSEVPVEVTGINASCSCTNVDLQGSKSLSPGEERIITGSVNFGGTIGHYTTTIAVTTKDATGNTEEVAIALRGKVVAALVLDRTRIDLGNVDIAAGPQVTTLDATRGNSGEQWDEVKSEADSTSLQARPESAADRVRVTIQFDPGELPLSTFRGNIKLRVFRKGIPLAESFEVPVIAHITGPLTVTPRSIYLGAVAAGQSLTRTLIIRSSSLDLRELKIEEQPTQGKAEIHRADNQTASVIVAFTPTQGIGAIADTVVVSHRSTGIRIKVPILGAIK